MSWNEPSDRDDKGKKKDPWGRHNGEEGPPNIDEALQKLQQRLRGLFGGGKGPAPELRMPGRPKKFGITIIVLILLAVYLVSGVYFVEPAEEAVVMRFGKYVGTYGSGPHWIAPFVETKEVVNVQEVKSTKHGGQMLTKDENIVSAEIAVQYRISNARDYLFNLVQPEKSLQQVSESALRSVVGQSTLNEVLTSGRGEIGAEIHRQIQQLLNNYSAGLEISDLAMQQTKAPEEVKTAFDDAIKAQQDEERLVNEAEAYSRKIIPIAEGGAKRTFEEARAYKEKVILESQGKTAKFSEILPEYKNAPQVTRERMRIDTFQQIYSNTPKVFIDVNGTNNILYLPLEQMMAKRSKRNDREEEDSQSGEKSSQELLRSRQIERPGYEDVERPNREGA